MTKIWHIQKYLFLLGFLLFCAALFNCCSNNARLQDIDQISAPIKLGRLEQDIDQIDTLQTSFKQQALLLKKQYPDFYPIYFYEILDGKGTDSLHLDLIKTIKQSPDFQILKADIDALYPADSPYLLPDFTQAFKYYRHYFPQDSLPRLITFMSGFENAVVTTPESLAIGLDMFLGADYRYYKSAGFPNYLIRKLTPQHLIVAAMQGFLKQRFELIPDNETLLNQAIYEGKILYASKRLLPKKPDSLLIGYTDEQLNWCKQYEADIWAHFVCEELLYETDPVKYRKYFNEAPFTPGLGKNSAPKLASWAGWQIVTKYMQKNPAVSLKELLANPNHQQILQQSGYKPKAQTS